MLVLSRKPNESIHIGDDIVVTVARLSGNRVRLAIHAPAHVSVKRSELLERLALSAEEQQSERRAAERAHVA